MLSRAAFVDAAIVTVAASAPPPYASRSGVATPPVLVTTCHIRTRAGCSQALSPLCRGSAGMVYEGWPCRHSTAARAKPAHYVARQRNSRTSDSDQR